MGGWGGGVVLVCIGFANVNMTALGGVESKTKGCKDAIIPILSIALILVLTVSTS